MTEASGVPILKVAESPAAPAPALKPGWQTSEFYFKHLAILLSVLIVSDVIPVGGVTMKIVTVAALWLTQEGYTVSRTIIKAGAPMLLFALLVHGTTACGASARDTKLHDAYFAAVSAETALHTYDLEHQVDLAQAAKDQASATVAVSAWIATRNKLDRDIAGAFRAIAAAAALNDDPSLTGAVQAGVIVAQELQALGVIP